MVWAVPKAARIYLEAVPMFEAVLMSPVSLIFGLLLGLISSLLPVAGIALIYTAVHPPVSQVETTRIPEFLQAGTLGWALLRQARLD